MVKNLLVPLCCAGNYSLGQARIIKRHWFAILCYLFPLTIARYGLVVYTTITGIGFFVGVE